MRANACASAASLTSTRVESTFTKGELIGCTKLTVRSKTAPTSASDPSAPAVTDAHSPGAHTRAPAARLSSRAAACASHRAPSSRTPHGARTTAASRMSVFPAAS